MKLRVLLATIVTHCLFTARQAQAQAPPLPIHACVIKATGLLRYVNDPSHCSPFLETPVQWMRSTTAISGTREPLNDDDARLPQFVDGQLPSKVVGSLSLNPGSYFITATVAIESSIGTTSAAAACVAEVGGTVLDAGAARRSTVLVVDLVHLEEPDRHTLTLHGAQKLNVPGTVRIRCAAHLPYLFQTFWRTVRISAVQVTEAQTVSLGAN